MALDTDLMEEEFIHDFGARRDALRWGVYDEIAAANDQFELIPQDFHGNNFREMYRADFLLNPRTKEKLDQGVMFICMVYTKVDELLREIEQQSRSHSPCFKLLQILMQLLKPAVGSFRVAQEPSLL